MNLRKMICGLATALTVFVPLASGQGTYTQIDVPGAQQTFLLGIDTADDVVGGYLDSSFQFHGFLLSGVYTTIDYPGQTDNTANGINDQGQIVGQYSGQSNGGFLYNADANVYQYQLSRRDANGSKRYVDAPR